MRAVTRAGWEISRSNMHRTGTVHYLRRIKVLGCLSFVFDTMSGRFERVFGERQKTKRKNKRCKAEFEPAAKNPRAKLEWKLRLRHQKLVHADINHAFNYDLTAAYDPKCVVSTSLCGSREFLYTLDRNKPSPPTKVAIQKLKI